MTSEASYATANNQLVCTLSDDTDAAFMLRYYSYNANGTIASVKVDYSADGDIENRADYTYDASGRVATIKIYTSVDADGENGTLYITRTYAYTGSALRPTTITQTNHNPGTTNLFAFSYSSDGKTITATLDNLNDGSINSSWTYTLSGNTDVNFELLEFMSLFPDA